MRNAVQWVKTYFERKELNRAYRRKTRPPHIDAYARRQAVATRLMVEFPEKVVRDVQFGHQFVQPCVPAITEMTELRQAALLDEG